MINRRRRAERSPRRSRRVRRSMPRWRAHEVVENHRPGQRCSTTSRVVSHPTGMRPYGWTVRPASSRRHRTAADSTRRTHSGDANHRGHDYCGELGRGHGQRSPQGTARRSRRRGRSSWLHCGCSQPTAVHPQCQAGVRLHRAASITRYSTRLYDEQPDELFTIVNPCFTGC